MYAGTWQPAANTAPRLSAFLETFLSWVSNPTTRDRYRYNLNNPIEYLHDPILSNVSTAHFYRYQVDCLKVGKSPATVNRDIAALRGLYSSGKKRGLLCILRNPCSDVEPLNEAATRRSGQPFTRLEESRITSLARGWFLVLFILLIEKGLRVRREALPLRWADVDLDSKPGRIIIRGLKTAAGIRTVFLTNYCCDALRKWKSLSGPKFPDFVFANPNNPSRHIEDYKRQWRAITKKAGVVGHRMFDTRSTFATRVNACAQSILTVAQLLGHKGTSVSVLPAYVRPLDENTRSMLNSLDVARAASTESPLRL